MTRPLPFLKLKTSLLVAVAGLLFALPAAAVQWVNIDGATVPGGGIASCRAEDRPGIDFTCATATQWVIGSGASLDCWAGSAPAAPPNLTCVGNGPAGGVFRCDGLSQSVSAHCRCPGNWVACGAAPGTCQARATGSCPTGQTLNLCTGVCEGDITVVLQTVNGSEATQGNAGTDQVIAVFGDVEADAFCTNGGTCLGGGAGAAEGKFAVGVNPVTGDNDAEYPLDVFADADTAVFRLTDVAGDSWTGSVLSRYNSGTNTIDEKWFIGMSDVSDDLRFRYEGADRMVLDTDGNLALGTVSDGEAPLHIRTGSAARGIYLEAPDTVGTEHTYSPQLFMSAKRGSGGGAYAEYGFSLGVDSGVNFNIYKLNGDIAATFADGNRMQFGNGFVTSPAYSFLSDTNTGMWRPAADSIGFVTGGVEQVRIDGGGNTTVEGNLKSNSCFGATFVGVTAASYTPSDIGSYAAANGLCDAAYAGAHVCTSGEILESISCNDGGDPIASATGVSGWVHGGPPGNAIEANDCGGWQNSAGDAYGRVWNFSGSSGGSGVATGCNIGAPGLPLSCCR